MASIFLVVCESIVVSINLSVPKAMALSSLKASFSGPISCTRKTSNKKVTKREDCCEENKVEEKVTELKMGMFSSVNCFSLLHRDRI